MRRSAKDDSIIVLSEDFHFFNWFSENNSLNPGTLGDKAFKKYTKSKSLCDFASYFDNSLQSEILVFVVKIHGTSEVAIVSYQFSTKAMSELLRVKLKFIFDDSSAFCISYLEQQDSLIVTAGKSLIYLSLATKSHYVYEHSCFISVLAFDSNSLMTAFGDNEGAIFTFPFDCLMAKNIKTKMEKLHWHSSRVSALLFTVNNQLTSGGSEGVLVNWNLESGLKHFVPRLSGTITSLALSDDGLMLAACLGDNSILIFSTSSMSPIQSIFTMEVLGGSSAAPSSSFTLTKRPCSDMLAISAGPHRIQFYNLHTNNHAYFQEITEHNTILSNIVEGIGSDTIISHIAFSSTAQHMITVETRIIAGIRKDNLKCWTFSTEKMRYVLNSIMESPHIDGLHSIVFPTNVANDNLMLSCGLDGLIRLWVFKPNRWICKFTRSFKSLIPTKANFSDDSSLLCVVFKKYITFWSVSSMTLLFAYSPTFPIKSLAPVQHSIFLRNSPFVAFSAGKVVFVFNIFTLCLSWKYDFNSECQGIFNLDNGYFCVFAGNQDKTKIFIFSSTEQCPITFYETSLYLAHITETFRDSESGILKFVALTATVSPSVVSFEVPLNPRAKLNVVFKETRSKKSISRSEDTLEKSFRNLFGFYEANPLNKKVPRPLSKFNSNPLQNLDIEIISSLALPPVSQFCDAFYNSLFINKS